MDWLSSSALLGILLGFTNLSLFDYFRFFERSELHKSVSVTSRGLRPNLFE